MDKFLNSLDLNIDVTTILGPDIDEMDVAVPPSSVFKYFSDKRSDFFEIPSIRFTQKSALNDEFEFSRRWKEFASPDTRRLFGAYIKKGFERLAESKATAFELYREELAKRGIFLNADEVAEASRVLLSNEGSAFFDQSISKAIVEVGRGVDLAFANMDLGADEILQEMMGQFGVFCVSEIPDNHQMWAHYASSGRGFVAEFDSEHPFFRPQDATRNLLRKVRYADEIISEFWQNPLYLFQVKERGWSFEREWRVLKNLSDCDAATGTERDVHICYVKPGMIKSIIFGYHYPKEELILQGTTIRSFDSNIKIQRAIPDFASRTIQIERLLD